MHGVLKRLRPLELLLVLSKGDLSELELLVGLLPLKILGYDVGDKSAPFGCQYRRVEEGRH